MTSEEYDEIFAKEEPWHLDGTDEVNDRLRMRVMASTADRPWTIIPWDRWTAFQYRGWPRPYKAKIEAALGDTIGQLPGWSGLVHFAIIIQDDEERRTCNIRLWAYRLDDAGRTLPDDFLPAAQGKRLNELHHIVYTNATDVLSPLKTAELERLRERYWRAMLPPAERIRALLLALDRPFLPHHADHPVLIHAGFGSSFHDQSGGRAN